MGTSTSFQLGNALDALSINLAQATPANDSEDLRWRSETEFRRIRFKWYPIQVVTQQPVLAADLGSRLGGQTQGEIKLGHWNVIEDFINDEL